MANADNKCANLEIVDLHKDSKDTLGDLMNAQKDLQEDVFNYDFENMTLREIKDFWFLNKHSEDDETNEMFDALGGINDGIGSGVWKNWKKSYAKGLEMKIKDLTEDDRKELFFEFIDKLHFVFNYAISIGMKPNEVYNYYMAKQNENRDRQKRGY